MLLTSRTESFLSMFVSWGLGAFDPLSAQRRQAPPQDCRLASQRVEEQGVLTQEGSTEVPDYCGFRQEGTF